MFILCCRGWNVFYEILHEQNKLLNLLEDILWIVFVSMMIFIASVEPV